MATKWQVRVSRIAGIDEASDILYVWGLTTPWEMANAVDGDPDLLTKRATKLHQLARDYGTAADKIEASRSTVDDYWGGAASVAYVKFMERVAKHISKLQSDC